jgi:hypoxanthine phosphoribosyltransferase
MTFDGADGDWGDRAVKSNRFYLSPEQIDETVRGIATRISRDYAGRTPLLITLLKGAFVFLADLVRNLTIPHEIDFISLSSYREGAKRSDTVKLIAPLSMSVENRDVIIVDDIVDTGHTLAKLIENIKHQRARSVSICTLLDKRSCREVAIQIDYSGFVIPDVFVVGYGLDFENHYRNLSHITELTPNLTMVPQRFTAADWGVAGAGAAVEVPGAAAGGRGPARRGSAFEELDASEPDS